MRLLRLAGMTASVAGGYAQSRVRRALGADADQEEHRFRKASGERIARTLGELKGAAMKVGQFASAARDLLPPELTDALVGLQRDSPPMAYEVIAEQIEKELGSPPELLFQHFERAPFAAASVGQVHRARTDDGVEVVVKVQYPGVDQAVDSDLSQVRLALRLGGLAKVPKDMLDATFGELRERLHEELDYCNEADNVRRFRAFHAGHQGLLVPDVVGERSSQRVLTLTYLPGRPLSDLDDPRWPQDLRDKLGTALGELITRQIFELKAIHGDPNPANFAWREDGSLVIYDFGCVKNLPDRVVDSTREILRGARDRDYGQLDRAMHDLGPLRPERSIPSDYYDRWLHAIAPPLDEEVYDFGRADLADRVKKLIPSAVKRAHWWQPAPEVVILDRMLAGHYDNLRTMRARVPARRLMLRFL
ncbi:MAG: AarF/ABC1/UbiB kinase family protein [Oligoflexia bacterium]|nr:AarF/ABC1/UbiB kinase family protein [Oligoflexia bacterium]